jgi:hypothetical protein
LAIILNNSVFIHIPKTGGKTISNILMSCVDSAQYYGDPVYDAHKSPDLGLPVFAFTRDPITWLHSVWHHRARKKKNKNGQRFNWQKVHRLERECKSYFFLKFMMNVSSNQGVITEYYDDFLSKYENVLFGKVESLSDSLVNILSYFNESFDEERLRDLAQQIHNPTDRKGIQKPNSYQSAYFDSRLRYTHKEFYEKHNY